MQCIICHHHLSGHTKQHQLIAIWSATNDISHNIKVYSFKLMQCQHVCSLKRCVGTKCNSCMTYAIHGCSKYHQVLHCSTLSCTLLTVAQDAILIGTPCSAPMSDTLMPLLEAALVLVIPAVLDCPFFFCWSLILAC